MFGTPLRVLRRYVVLSSRQVTLHMRRRLPLVSGGAVQCHAFWMRATVYVKQLAWATIYILYITVCYTHLPGLCACSVPMTRRLHRRKAHACMRVRLISWCPRYGPPAQRGVRTATATVIHSFACLFRSSSLFSFPPLPIWSSQTASVIRCCVDDVRTVRMSSSQKIDVRVPALM